MKLSKGQEKVLLATVGAAVIHEIAIEEVHALLAKFGLGCPCGQQ